MVSKLGPEKIQVMGWILTRIPATTYLCQREKLG